MRDATVVTGDCLEVMAGLEPDSVDAVITDPPYGIGFMGEGWDRSIPGVEYWAAALRVAKPGAHLLAFGGTRLHHRLWCAIEDAGWVVRDTLGWLYGTGWPKNLDVGKQIDRANGSPADVFKFTAWARGEGVPARALDDALRKAGLIKETCNLAVHFTNDKQPLLPTPEQWVVLRGMFQDVPGWVDTLVARTSAPREVVGRRRSSLQGTVAAGKRDLEFIGRHAHKEYDVTTSSTSLARRWDGWGTALKPAWEPILLARKPFVGTVASNVQNYGTGALNIDACRNAAPAGDREDYGLDNGANVGLGYHGLEGRSPYRRPPKGRWPANILHDGSPEVEAVFPESPGGDLRGACCGSRPGGFGNVGANKGSPEPCGTVYADTGSASRFFYCCKASAQERQGNTHTTVKPIALMQYLCRLITPPNGLILDPFAGSGSTGVAALNEHFRFLGIELNPDYANIALSRIDNASKGQQSFPW